MRHFRAGEGTVAASSFTPDGETLVCVEAGEVELHRAVRWLDPRTGELRRTLELWEDGQPETVPSSEEAWPAGEVFVSPDGQWVAVRKAEHFGDHFGLWNAKMEEWQPVERGDEFETDVEGVCYSVASDLLIFGSGTFGGGLKTLVRLDLKTGRRLPGIKCAGHLHSARRLQLSPDERLLAVLDYGFSVRALPHDRKRDDAGELVKLKLEMNDSASLRFSPSGDELAIVDGHQLFFWDCKSPDAVKWAFDGKGVNDLAYSPDGRLLALGCDDGTVVLHDRQKKREVARYDWRIGRVVSIAFAADGMTAAVGGEGGRIVVWDVDN